MVRSRSSTNLFFQPLSQKLSIFLSYPLGKLWLLMAIGQPLHNKLLANKGHFVAFDGVIVDYIVSYSLFIIF